MILADRGDDGGLEPIASVPGKLASGDCICGAGEPLPNLNPFSVGDPSPFGGASGDGGGCG